MYLFNPNDGATVRDIWIFDKLYFSEAAQEEFKPGDIIDIDEKVGVYLQELCGFLKVVNSIEAKNIIAKRGMEKFICDVCHFEAKNQLGLSAHKRTHESIVDGVRVVHPIETEEKQEEEDNKEKAIEQEAKNSGLFGEGLVQDKP